MQDSDWVWGHQHEWVLAMLTFGAFEKIPRENAKEAAGCGVRRLEWTENVGVLAQIRPRRLKSREGTSGA